MRRYNFQFLSAYQSLLVSFQHETNMTITDRAPSLWKSPSRPEAINRTGLYGLKSGFDVENEQGSPNHGFKGCRARTAGNATAATDAGKYDSAVPQRQWPPLRLTCPSSKVHAARRLREPRKSPFPPPVAALQQSHRCR